MAHKTYDFGFIRYDIDQEEYEFLAFDTIDEMFTYISKIYCFSDCDNTFQVCAIYAWGQEVKFVGWQPDMHYEYRTVKTNELAWEGWFPQWEH